MSTLTKMIIFLFSVSLGVYLGAYTASRLKADGKFPFPKRADCWPISLAQYTGTIRCYSGGHLVYENSIYYNGGILCAVSGKEIKITGGKSLCVIESWQPDNWTPPQ